MKRIESFYNKDAWSEQVNDSGNVVVSTIMGVEVCEIQHPVLIDEQNLDLYNRAVKEFKGNVMLIRHANATAIHMERLYTVLCELKTGKTTVFDVDLEGLIKETETVLVRATKLD